MRAVYLTKRGATKILLPIMIRGGKLEEACHHTNKPSLSDKRRTIVKIGLQIPRFTWPGGAAELATRLKAIVQTADDAGFYSIWVMDHFFQIPGVGEAEEPMMEGYSTLSYIAALTQRAKLGTLVNRRELPLSGLSD
jgi:hypothetical protein